MAGPLVETLVRIRSQYDSSGTQQAKQDVAQLEGGIARAGQAASLLSNRFRNAFLGLSAAATGTVVAFAGVQKAQVNLQRVSNLGGRDFEALAKNLKDMAPSLGLTQSGILDLATNAARLGIEGQDLITFIKTAAQSAAALNQDVGSTGETLAKLRANLVLSVPDLNKLTGAIVALDNVSAATFPAILQAMTAVGPVAKLLGVSGQNLAALSATIIETGISAEVAGTALSQVFQSLLRRSEKIGPILGMTGEQLRRLATTDAVGTMRILAERFATLNRTGQDTGEFLKALGLDGRRSTAVLAVLGDRTQRLNELMGESNDEFQRGTILQRLFGLQSETLAFRWAQVKSEVLAAASAIGEKLAPVALKIIGFIERIAKAIKDSPLLQYAVGIGLVGAAIAAAVGFLTFFVASQAIAFRIARTELPLMVGMYTRLATSIRSAAVAQAQFGLSGNVAGVGMLRRTGTALGNLATGALGFVRNPLQGVRNLVGSVRTASALQGGAAAAEAAGLGTMLFGGAGTARLASFMATAANGFRTLAGLAGRFLLPLTVIMGVFDAISNNIMGARDALGRLLEPLREVFSSSENGIGSFMGVLKSLASIIGGILGTIIRVVAEVLRPVIVVISEILKVVFTAIEIVLEPIKAILDAIASIFGFGPEAPQGYGSLPTLGSTSPEANRANLNVAQPGTSGSYSGEYRTEINFNNLQVRSQQDIDAVRRVVNEELRKAAARR